MCVVAKDIKNSDLKYEFIRQQLITYLLQVYYKTVM